MPFWTFLLLGASKGRNSFFHVIRKPFGIHRDLHTPKSAVHLSTSSGCLVRVPRKLPLRRKLVFTRSLTSASSAWVGHSSWSFPVSCSVFDHLPYICIADLSICLQQVSCNMLTATICLQSPGRLNELLSRNYRSSSTSHANVAAFAVLGTCVSIPPSCLASCFEAFLRPTVCSNQLGEDPKVPTQSATRVSDKTLKRLV